MDNRWAARGLRAAFAVVIGAGAAGVLAGTAPSAAAPSPRPALSSTTFETPPVTWAAMPPPTVAPVSVGSTPTTSRPQTPASPGAAAPAAVTPVAPAATTSGGTVQERGEAALRRLSYPYQQLGYTIVFLPGMPGYFGRGFHEQHRIEIYVRNSQSDAELAHVVAHEIGHAVDWMYHTPARDQQWLRLRGVDPSTEWAPCPFCTDFGAPSGDFAETFALWQLGQTSFAGTLAPRPSAAQLQELSKLFYP
jgi:hypothetical protein